MLGRDRGQGGVGGPEEEALEEHRHARVLHAHVGVAGDVGPAAHEAQHVLQREGVVGAVLPVDLEDAPRRGPLGVAGRLAVAAAQVPPGEDELQALDQGAAHGRRRCRRR
ncbi:hypothetical protein EG873_15655, partial [Enterococcus faecalis]